MTEAPNFVSGACATPLAEASPQSLQELFSRDPLSYSRQDLQTICDELRRQRAAWIKAEARGQKAPKAAKTQAGGDINLEELGL